MKKIFGLTVLLAAVLFSSCSFNNTHKKGSVDFSIPIGEILAYKNQISAREAFDDDEDETQEEPTNTVILTVLVQIKGNRGYYDAQMQKTDITDFVNSLDGNENDSDPDRFLSIPDLKLNYHFDGIPVNQSYTIMAQIFSENIQSYNGDNWIYDSVLFSGDKSGISLIPDNTTQVVIDMDIIDEKTYSPFDLQFVSNNSSDTKEINPEKDFYIAYCEEDSKYYYPKDLSEEENFGATELTNQKRTGWKELTDIRLVIKDYFLGFDVKQDRIIGKGSISGMPVYEPYPLDFSNGYYSFLKENFVDGEFYIDSDVLIISKKIRGEEFSFLAQFPNIQVTSIKFATTEDDEKGSLTVSIPGITQQDIHSTEGSDNTMQYTYLVQVSSISDNAYYAAQVKTVNEEELKEAQTFTFENLSSGKNYKAMVDIYSQSIYEGQTGHSLLTYAGDEKIQSFGDTNSIEVTAEPTSVYSYSNFYLFLTCEENVPYGKEVESAEGFSVLFAKCKDESKTSEEYKYYCRQKKSADEEIPQFGFTDENPDDWTEIKDFYFGLKEDSHYRKFTFVQPIKNDNEEETIDIVFDDNNLFKVTDYLEGNNFIFNYPLSATLTFDDGSTFEASLVTPQVTFSDITFAKKQEGEAFTETDSGEITIEESKLSFTHWNDQENSSTIRYMTTVPLDDILNGKHLSDDDTVVFVLSITGMIDRGDIISDIIGNYVEKNQFYYQLQEDNWETIYIDDDEGLFKNNNCINYDARPKGDYTFVMPLNLIQDAEDYRNLQLFFDCAKSNIDDEKLEFDCSIKYTIFPAVEKAFVFGVGKNWDKITDEEDPNYDPTKPDYRYEVNIPLRDLYGNPLNLKKDDTVKVYLQGKVRSYTTAFETLDRSTTFTAELYDNAEYEGSNFHALSIDKLDEGTTNPDNRKQLTMGSDGGLAYSGEFVFSPIAEPYVSKTDPDFKNDFRFQCHTPCENPGVLIVVTDYFFTNQIISGSD